MSSSTIGSRVGRPSYENALPFGGERGTEVEDEADGAGEGDLVERVETLTRFRISPSPLTCAGTGVSVLADIPAVFKVGAVDERVATGTFPRDARGLIPEPAIPQFATLVDADGEREREREVLREDALVAGFKAVRDGLGDILGG